MNEQIMFTVFYNPITKDIYRNPEGNVYDVYAPIIDEERGLYEELSKKGYILKDVTEHGIGGTLSYIETFCYCDRCGKLFLQDDLSFTDQGAPYCSKCYELYETYDTYFHCLGLPIVSRGDYENMPAPMYAGEFDDDQMKELAKSIYLTLTNDYSYTDRELEKYFNDNSANVNENINTVFWREMEVIAVSMGMRYYEDMSEEEYKKVCNK